MSNAEFYLNDWLAAHEGMTMEEGVSAVRCFLGDWYIQLCLWSSPSNIKTTATSLKKFYRSMAEHEHISQNNYEELVWLIKTDTPEWQRKCVLYDDPDMEWEDIAEEFGFFM